MSTKLEKLGIDINTTYEIGGCMDDINVLFHYVFQDLDYLSDALKDKSAPFITEIIDRIKQLLYVVEKENNNANEQLEELFKQLYSLDKEENTSFISIK